MLCSHHAALAVHGDLMESFHRHCWVSLFAVPLAQAHNSSTERYLQIQHTMRQMALITCSLLFSSSHSAGHGLWKRDKPRLIAILWGSWDDLVLPLSSKDILRKTYWSSALQLVAFASTVGWKKDWNECCTRHLYITTVCMVLHLLSMFYDGKQFLIKYSGTLQ